MNDEIFDEVVFTVAGSTATPAKGISLSEAGLTERSHLQEWVIAHPKMLGSDVLIVTFEFDQWSAAGGTPKDRLDVLGLGRDGRLVVAELKRNRAPDTVEMQAIKYAAMASRFTESLLAEQHSRYCAARETPITETAALEKLQGHSDVGLQPELLAQPRIVLLAEDFPPTVTATAVWLNEMGIDLALMRYQAYRTGVGEIVLTVSQLYPVPKVGAFEVAPHSRAAKIRQDSAPEVPWTAEDLAVLAQSAGATTLAIMDLCAERPDEWIGASDAYGRAGVLPASGIGQLGGFGITVRNKFGRSNPPYDRQWGAGEQKNQNYYRLSPELAAEWTAIRVEDPGFGDEDGRDLSSTLVTGDSPGS